MNWPITQANQIELVQTTPHPPMSSPISLSVFSAFPLYSLIRLRALLVTAQVKSQLQLQKKLIENLLTQLDNNDVPCCQSHTTPCT